jgi:formate--tetrahydrofolate ligase
MKSGLEIAQEAVLRPIAEIAEAAGIQTAELEPYGNDRAKIDLSILDRLAGRPDGKLVITTAITPTKAGEGKTTTSVSLTQGLGKIGKDAMLCLRENPWVIVAASEIMAIFALANDLQDLRARMGRIVVGFTYDGAPVTAEQLKVAGAMTVIMKDAIEPNLVQTLEGQPALVHAGPFGNIAHANNSIIADRVALKLADYVVTESGFASDLGLQKFCDIVCRLGGFTPSAAVLVTTVRATKSHGGKSFADLAQEDLDALQRGADNLAAHINIVRQYGLPCVVAINNFPTDTDKEIALIEELAIAAGAERVVVNRGFAQGGEGAVGLANAVVEAAEQPNEFDFLTPDATTIKEQVEAIALRLYGAEGVDYLPQAEKDLARMDALGYGDAPVCMAKTHLSLSHDASLLNRPTGFRLPVRGVVPAAGAGFVVVLCGDMQRMPGLGKTPAFVNIDVDEEGRTVGLF